MRRLATAAAFACLAICLLAPSALGAHPYRYPLKGVHNYGNLAVTGFGVKRSDGSVHTGQDIVAPCGTPVIAAHAAEVREVGKSAGYGNFIVLRGKGTRFDFVYGHMKGRARVGAGRSVKPGKRIGSVGRTGTSSRVCHLHFELWKGRWFAGGRRTDPLLHLQGWDQYSGGPLVEPPPAASKRLYLERGE